MFIDVGWQPTSYSYNVSLSTLVSSWSSILYSTNNMLGYHLWEVLKNTEQTKNTTDKHLLQYEWRNYDIT